MRTMRRNLARTLPLALVVLAMLVGTPGPARALELEPDALYLFWGEGCPHCEAEWDFLAALHNDYPELQIRSYEVWGSDLNRALFEDVMGELAEPISGVPVTIIGDRVFHGYNDAIGGQIRAAVEALFVGASTVPEPAQTIDLPWLGVVDIGRSSLVVSTVAIAFVDGINPCSLWAMSVLMALVLRAGSRKRTMAIGGTFLLVTTVLYGLYIAGLYGALSYLAGADWVRWGMALLALGLGLFTLKDFFWFGQGPSLAISEKARPGLYRRMRRVARPDQPIGTALAGTAALAVGVSLLETPCTAGYPVLWTNLLTDQGVALAGATVLFLVYMTVFLIDELVVLGVAVVAMRATKLEERGGRLLKLVGGMVMVVLAGTLILVPTAMESVAGALGVFGVAAVLSVVVLAGERLWAGNQPPPERGR